MLLNLVIHLVKYIYERIFHEKVSTDVEGFIKNLCYIAIGTLIAAVAGLVTNILAGRILGASEYGTITLIISIASFLSVPMLLGFVPAMVKYASEKDDLKRQTTIISTTYILVILCSLVSIGFYLVLSPQISKLLSVSQEIFYFAIILTIITVIFTLSANTLRGLHKMKSLAIFRPISTFIILFSFLFYIFQVDLLNYKSLFYSTFLAYGITAVIILVFILHKHIKLQFSKSWASKLVKYAIFGILGGFSYMVYTNIDKILINTYMTTADVGIYKVYLVSSIGVVGILQTIIVTVFFPTVSKYRNKKPILDKINKLVPHITIMGIPFVLLCEFIILKLYGNQYPVDPLWMMLFAVASILIIIQGLYLWLLNSVGSQGIKITAYASLITAILNIGLNILLIPLIGITGAIGSTIIVYIVSILLVYSFGRKYLIRQTIT